MKVIKVENQVEGGKVAFEILREKLANGAQTLGLATGSSPLEFYKEIVESDLDFSNLTSVNLDEYVGLDGDNPQSYRYFMQENLFNHVDQWHDSWFKEHISFFIFLLRDL